jgi:hypothetical protein
MIPPDGLGTGVSRADFAHSIRGSVPRPHVGLIGGNLWMHNHRAGDFPHIVSGFRLGLLLEGLSLIRKELTGK